MQVKEVLEKTIDFFKRQNIESARLDAEILISYALKLKRIDLYLKQEYPLTQQELQSARELVQRRSKGEPIAYILGSRGFYKHDFIVSPAVLIPRPETELLVERAIKFIKDKGFDAPVIVDLGAGTGCIGHSVLCEFSDAKQYSVDISMKAQEVAKQNAEALGVISRTHFLLKDAATVTTKDTQGKVDLVLANPPYISKNDKEVQPSVVMYEPHEALFAEQEGFSCIQSWAKVAAELLKSRGIVIFEIGATQAAQSKEFFAATNSFEGIECTKDYAGLDRFILAIRK